MAQITKAQDDCTAKLEKSFTAKEISTVINQYNHKMQEQRSKLYMLYHSWMQTENAVPDLKNHPVTKDQYEKLEVSYKKFISTIYSPHVQKHIDDPEVAESLYPIFGIPKTDGSTPNDVMYVISLSGLKIYSDSSKNSETIAVIPYHAEVEVEEKSKTIEIINGKKGSWIKVKWVNNETSIQGWGFSVFLSEEIPEILFNVPAGAVAGTPLKLNIVYCNPDYFESKRVFSDSETSFDNTEKSFESHSECIIFFKNNTFQKTNSSSYSYYRGESFSDSEVFSGNYKASNHIINIKNTRCEKQSYASSEGETNKTEKFSGNEITGRFLCAETADKYLLIGADGALYTADKTLKKQQ